jgi:hypothetical protein
MSDDTKTGTELVPHAAEAQLVEMETDRVPDLGSAVTQLQKAVAQMAPDDLVFEFSQESSDKKQTTHLRLRAYRRGNGSG